MKPFDQGWRDYLRGLSPRTTYRKSLPMVQYERGRHIAAMWHFWLKAQGCNAEPYTSASYETARKLMPQSLLLAIFHEEQFCSKASELMVGTS